MNSIYPPIEKSQKDKDLDRILSLYEIIKKYELLTQYLLENQTSKSTLGERGLQDIIDETIEKIEKEIIHTTLTETNFNRIRAAKILKISYKTLLSKMTRYNIIGSGQHKKKPDYVGV